MRIQGLARCTGYYPPLEKLIANKELGPDKDWTLLSAEGVRDLCAGKELLHLGRQDYDHVCAAYSKWAFDAQDSSYIRCVAFLHYARPSKLAELMGPVEGQNKEFKFDGGALVATYQRLLVTEHGEVHVWQRQARGEIAIDFCLTDKATLPNAAGRLVLPDFIPK